MRTWVTSIAVLVLLASACGGSTSKTPRATATPQATPTALAGIGGEQTVDAATRIANGVKAALTARATTPEPTPIARLYIGPLQAVDFLDQQHGWTGGKVGILATSDGGEHWHKQGTISQPIITLDFVSPLVGWASGFDRLFGTTDGGETWQPLADTYNPFVDLDFVNSSVGWGISTNRPQDWPSGLLMRTVDGGRTWSSVTTSIPAQSLCAVSRNDIWVAGDTSVLHSTDGGATWSTAFTAPMTHGWFAVLRCAGQDTMWVEFRAGAGAAMQSPFIVFRTLDRGSHWDVMISEAYFGTYNSTPAPQNLCCYAGPVVVPDVNSAFVMGRCVACDLGTTNILRTLDGGTTWSTAIAVPTKSVSFDAADAAFIDAQRGWAVGVRRYRTSQTPDYKSYADEADIFATADGGLTWTQQYP